MSDHSSLTTLAEPPGAVADGAKIAKRAADVVPRPPPWGWKWRSSTLYCTSVVAVAIGTDSIVYQIIVPVLPFRFEELGYTSITVLTSWLFFSYVIPILILSFPIAHWLHKHPWRRGPLVAAVLVLEASCFVLMFVRPFWAMIVARVFQGAAAAVVWSVGFALICENVAKESVGRQIGFAWAGAPIGMIVAPPIGGALYQKVGWYAPQVFCAALCVFDLVGRWPVIERKDLGKYDLPVGSAGEKEKEQRTRTAVRTGQAVEAGTVRGIGGAEKDTREAVPARGSSVAALHARPVLSPHRAGLSSSSVTLHLVPSTIPTPTGPSPTIRSHQAPHSLVPSIAHSHSQTTLAFPDGGHNVISAPSLQDSNVQAQLSIWRVLAKLLSSPRGVTALWLNALYGLVYGALDPTLTLRVATVWHKDSLFVGVIYVIACGPTALGCPLAGYLADRFGAEWVVLPALVLMVPWTLTLMLKDSLPGFMICFLLLYFFLSTSMSPVGLEVALVAQETEGISEIHQFAAVNIAYSFGTLVGGNIYNSTTAGWNGVCWYCFACCVASIGPAMAFTGNRPLLARVVAYFKRARKTPGVG